MFRKRKSQPLVIQFGSGRTRMMCEERIVLDEQSLIIEDIRTGEVLIAGDDAVEPAYNGGMTKDCRAVCPIRHHLIKDAAAAVKMLKWFLRHKVRLSDDVAVEPLVLLPHNAPRAYEQLLREVLRKTGFRQGYVMDEMFALAFGQGIDVLDTEANMLIQCTPAMVYGCTMALGGCNPVVDMRLELPEADKDNTLRLVTEAIRLAWNAPIHPELRADVERNGIYLFCEDDDFADRIMEALHDEIRIQHPLHCDTLGMAAAYNAYDAVHNGFVIRKL